MVTALMNNSAVVRRPNHAMTPRSGEGLYGSDTTLVSSRYGTRSVSEVDLSGEVAFALGFDLGKYIPDYV
ncbi:MAG: hypothetical protein ACRDUA_15615, partial [Micromonosporaceae bacterium]